MAATDHDRDEHTAPRKGVHARLPHLYFIGAERATADLEVVVALAGTVAFLALWLLPVELIAPWLGDCRFKSLFGIPCASCGVTRGVLALARGEFREAVAQNPLLITLILVGFAYTPWALASWVWRLPRMRLSLGSGWPRHLVRGGLLLLLIVLLGLNWGYLVTRGM